MKKFKNRRIVILSVILIVALVTYFPAKLQINRLFDNRERAVMSRHELIIKQEIQAIARQDGSYPTGEKVEKLVLTLNLISPHTHKNYDFVGGISNISQVKDSKIAYGFGDNYENKTTDNSKAYFCMGINMPRTNEAGAGCAPLRLDSATDKRIKYALSCKTNWLGFSTGCDKSILQAH